MSIAIVTRRDCDVDDIIRRVSKVDNTPNAEFLLRRWLKSSNEIWLGLYDGETACVWGLFPVSILSNRAYLWLITTSIVDEHKFLFVRHSQLVIEEALKLYPQIIGHVEVGNDRARKWLRWLGAEIGSPKNGQSPFIIRRK